MTHMAGVSAEKLCLCKNSFMSSLQRKRKKRLFFTLPANLWNLETVDACILRGRSKKECLKILISKIFMRVMCTPIVTNAVLALELFVYTEKEISNTSPTGLELSSGSNKVIFSMPKNLCRHSEASKMAQVMLNATAELPVTSFLQVTDHWLWS